MNFFRLVRRFLLTASLIVAGIAGLAAQQDAAAQNIVFPVRSDYPYRVQISFYSETRNWEWPGGGQAYDLNDAEVHSFNLNCQSGEKICYGAWVTGNAQKFWGVGYQRRQSCNACCYVCGAGTISQITLTE